MKKTLSFLSLALVSALTLPQMVLAVGEENYNNYVSSINLGSADLFTTVINAVNWILGLLILIAVIIILVGGFKWMTAGGNDDKISGARQTIVSGIIGLIIVLAAYAIASFVITQFSGLTGGIITT
ncbi:MAG: hypothetical protein WCW02_03345 [Candidatus Buchananbacteria bacterium]